MARDATDHGIVRLPSPRPFAATLQRLLDTLAAQGITVFATVDHQAAASAAGLVMPATTLVIFGKPEAGTPLMLARPSVALDLPSRALVSEDAEGRAWLSYNATSFLAERHALPRELAARLAPLEQLLRQAVAS